MRHAATPTRCALTAALVLLVGCATATPIAEVRQRASELEGRRVSVAGEVVETLSLPLVQARYYQIEDESGRLWVQTRQPLPAEGERLRVTGTLAPGFKAGTLELGLVLEEQRRR